MLAEDAKHISVVEENASKFRSQADTLQGKLLEEQTRRQRAEERARVMKEYADKAKVQCSSLESANAELKAQVVELNSRTQKYRKGYKDIVADAAAHKSTMGERETELMRQQARTERVESKLRSVSRSRLRLRTVRLFS
jgi:chromosome segregation ATPase